LSGNSNNGTLTNGPAYTASNGGGIVFDGVDDRVECGTATASAGTTTTILTVVTGSTTAIFFDYTVASGSNVRAGTITGVWNGANVQYSDRSTLDIGNTSEVTMSVSLSGANALLAATAVAYPWIVKAIYRVI
jgi:hypothetical protein